MDEPMHTASIFTRYDFTLEQEHCPAAREVVTDLLLQRVADCLPSDTVPPSEARPTVLLHGCAGSTLPRIRRNL